MTDAGGKTYPLLTYFPLLPATGIGTRTIPGGW